MAAAGTVSAVPAVTGPRTPRARSGTAPRRPGLWRTVALPAVSPPRAMMAAVPVIFGERTSRRPVRRTDAAAGGRLWPLAVVAAAFAAAQLAFVSPGMGLGWDETVYVSQVSPHIPAALFSAPRARGISLLAAPVALVTTSTVALRVYFALLSGAALFVVLLPWRRLRTPGALALAGVLFTGLWITQFYGPQAMPNLWVALGGLAAVGCFLRVAAPPEPAVAGGTGRPPRPAGEPAARDSSRARAAAPAGDPSPGRGTRAEVAPDAAATPGPRVAAAGAGPDDRGGVGTGTGGTGSTGGTNDGRRYTGTGGAAPGSGAAAGVAPTGGTVGRSGAGGRVWPPAGLAAGLAFVALMRPSDAAWLAVPLLTVAAFAGGRRRWLLLAAVAGGLAAGGAEWVVEAYTSYGGLPARLHTASRIEGGIGWHVAIGDQLRALDGRTLCRPCDVAWRHPVTSLWWLALWPLVAGGVAAGVRDGRRLSACLPALCGSSVAVPYLFLIDYAAPRFLLPAYALLAIPAADLLARPFGPRARSTRPRLRAATAGLAVAGLAGHLTVQEAVLVRTAGRNVTDHADYARVAADLHRLGVRPPCLLTGDEAIPIAYYARCASAETGGNNADTTAAGIVAATAHRAVALVTAPGARPPAYARGWTGEQLPGLTTLRGYRAFVSPRGLHH